MKKEKILVTCALPYANGPLHAGHIRSTYLPADIYVRYLRMKGKDVAFICGSDEHGTPITITAEKEKSTPQEIAKKYHKIMGDELKRTGIIFDIFSRTTTKTNYKNAQEFFIAALKKGFIYEKEVEQYYCEACKRFLPDRYVEGNCPNCEYEGARGDHCDKCGQSLSTLKNPYCIVCKSMPELRKTKHWFFKLTAFKVQLEKFLARKEIPTNVKNYALEWLPRLQDWCITRDLVWGVPVPLREAKDKVLYVWWDAPIGYISATQEWNAEKGLEYWKKGKIIHFIGKDIIYHHALFWPAMLLAHAAYHTPHTIIAGEYLSLEGKKMSTSRSWVVWLSDFLNKYPADYLRYYLTINTPLAADMDFSWKEFEARINNELSDVLGNFIHRTLTFVHKFFKGKIPKPGKLSETDKKIIAKIAEAQKNVGEKIEEFNFLEALKAIMELCRAGNVYFNEKQPWKDEKTRPTTIYIAANLVNAISILLFPFLPETALKIGKQLGKKQNVAKLKWANATEKLKPGAKISAEIKPLIQKVEIREEIKFSGKKLVCDSKLRPEINSGNLSVAVAEVAGLSVQKRIGSLEKLKEETVKKLNEHELLKTIDTYRYMLETIDRGTEGLSSENLLNFVKKSGQLPNINTLTDIYNLISLKTGLIMGAYDIKGIDGDVYLKVTDGTEKFSPIGTNKLHKIYGGEYVVADSGNNVITRWLTKESEKVKITEYTKGAIICVQGNRGITQEKVNNVLKEVCELIVKYCGGKYKILFP